MIEMSDFPSDTRLIARDLTCRRGGRTVFTGLHFDLSASQYLCLKGCNGAGKSSLLRVLAGLGRTVDGQVYLEKGDQKHPLSATDFLLAGHQNGLKPAFSLSWNMDMLALLHTGTKPEEERLQNAARHFGLLPLLNEPVQYFSSGQRHRSALMRFALIDRQIWLMDEPTVGLDAQNRHALEVLMTQHLARGGMILAATHDPINVRGDVLNLDDFASNPSTTAHTHPAFSDEIWL